MRRWPITVALLLAAGPAYGWDAVWAVRPDATVTPRLSLGFAATIPLTESPRERNALGGTLRGGVDYVDDDKRARLDIIAVTAYTIWREQRSRYEGSSMPALAFFDLGAQLRVLPHLHVLYGAGLMRSGVRAHARVGGLSLHLGIAIPLLGDRRGMREYHRAHLQVETRPLSISLLTFLDLEGSTDRDPPVAQAAGEVALAGRIETRRGVFEGDLRLATSYCQRSLYVIMSVDWEGPLLFWRVAPWASVRYLWPGQPLRRNISEDAQALFYGHTLTFEVGLSVNL